MLPACPFSLLPLSFLYYSVSCPCVSLTSLCNTYTVNDSYSSHLPCDFPSFALSFFSFVQSLCFSFPPANATLGFRSWRKSVAVLVTPAVSHSGRWKVNRTAPLRQRTLGKDSRLGWRQRRGDKPSYILTWRSDGNNLEIQYDLSPRD